MSGFGCKSTQFWNENNQLLPTLSQFSFLYVPIFETEVTICYPLYQNFHSLIDHIHYNAPIIAHRLGEKKIDRPRPIKLVMETMIHKTEFMSKLWKLKYAGTAHKKARITDDYTWEEREEIKRWVMMAKDKSKKDIHDGNVWKVRGTPKSGLRLVQVCKQWRWRTENEE